MTGAHNVTRAYFASDAERTGEEDRQHVTVPYAYGLGNFSYFRSSSSAFGSTTKVPDTTYAPCPAHKISKATHCIDSAVCFVLLG